MKAYTDIEQSKKLAEILPIESADMRYGYVAPYDFSDRMYDGGYDEVPYPKNFLLKNPNFSANEYDGELPAWSLAALLDIIPEPVLTYIDKDSWNISTFENNHFKEEVISSNPIDACYEMILKLNELKLL